NPQPPLPSRLAIGPGPAAAFAQAAGDQQAPDLVKRLHRPRSEETSTAIDEIISGALQRNPCIEMSRSPTTSFSACDGKPPNQEASTITPSILRTRRLRCVSCFSRSV